MSGDERQHPLIFDTLEQEIRLHALNLATALHRDTARIRFAKKGDEEPPEAPLGDQVLADARQFAAWLERGDVKAVAS